MDERLIPGSDGTACSWGAAYASVIAFGAAKVLEDVDEKSIGLNVLMKTQTGREYELPDAAVARINVIRIDVDEFTCKAKYDAS